MYSLVRRFIKTGLGFGAAGLVLGVWMLAAREVGGRWPNPWLVSAHAHAVLVGFVMFLILGVALWLFPRPGKDDARYRPGRIEAAYRLLAVSTAARLVTEAARAWVHAPWLGWIVLAGGVGQAAGLVLYFWTLWGRIRPSAATCARRRGNGSDACLYRSEAIRDGRLTPRLEHWKVLRGRRFGSPSRPFSLPDLAVHGAFRDDVIPSGAAAPNSQRHQWFAAPEESMACVRAIVRLSLGRR